MIQRQIEMICNFLLFQFLWRTQNNSICHPTWKPCGFIPASNPFSPVCKTTGIVLASSPKALGCWDESAPSFPSCLQTLGTLPHSHCYPDGVGCSRKLPPLGISR